MFYTCKIGPRMVFMWTFLIVFTWAPSLAKYRQFPIDSVRVNYTDSKMNVTISSLKAPRVGGAINIATKVAVAPFAISVGEVTVDAIFHNAYESYRRGCLGSLSRELYTDSHQVFDRFLKNCCLK